MTTDLADSCRKAMLSVLRRSHVPEQDREDMVQDVLAACLPLADSNLAPEQNVAFCLQKLRWRIYDRTKRYHQIRQGLSVTVNMSALDTDTRTVEDVIGADPHVDVEEQVLRGASNPALWRAMSNLPQQQLEVLYLHCVEGKRLEDLRVLLDVPMGTVKSRLNRGLNNMRRAMTDAAE